MNLKKILFLGALVLLCACGAVSESAPASQPPALVPLQGTVLRSPSLIDMDDSIVFWDNVDDSGVIQLLDPQSGKLLDELTDLPHIFHLRRTGEWEFEAVLEGGTSRFITEDRKLVLASSVTLPVHAPFGYDYGETGLVYADEQGLKLRPDGQDEDTLLFPIAGLGERIGQPAKVSPKAAPYLTSPRFVGGQNFVAASVVAPTEQAPVTGLLLFDLQKSESTFLDFTLGGHFSAIDDNTLAVWHDHNLELVSLPDMKTETIREISGTGSYAVSDENGGSYVRATLDEGGTTLTRIFLANPKVEQTIASFENESLWVRGLSEEYVLLRNTNGTQYYLHKINLPQLP